MWEQWQPQERSFDIDKADSLIFNTPLKTLLGILSIHLKNLRLLEKINKKKNHPL